MIEHVIEYYEVYEVYESYDRETRSVAKFSRLVDAQALKATSNCFVISKLKKDRIVIYESFGEYQEATSVAGKRKLALEKLTEEDKKFLVWSM